MAKVLIEFVSDTGPATQGAAEVEGALGKLGSKAGAVAAGGLALAAAGVAAVGVAAGAAAVSAFNLSSDIDAATGKMATDLGISKEAAAGFEDVMKGVFGNNFGEDFADIGASIAEVTRQLGSLPDAELQSVTEQTLAMRDAWDLEVGESIGAVDALMENFGLTSQEALDFVAAGMQRGLNSSGDFLDTITEYGTQFNAGGASADQFFSLMETGLQNGVLGTDKAADMFKEFRLIMTEGGPEIEAALKSISGPTEDLMGQIESGQLSIADAFQMINDRLGDLDDPIEAQRLGVQLMGTQFEDMGTQAALAVDLTGTKLSELEGATESLNAQYDNWPSMWEGIKRSALLALEPLGDKAFELARDILPKVQDVFENQIVPAIEKVVDWVSQFIALIQESEDPVQMLSDLVLDLIPQEVIDRFSEIVAQVEDFASKARDDLAPVVERATGLFRSLGDLIQHTFQPTIDRIIDAFGSVKGQLDPMSDALGQAQDAFSRLWGVIGPFVTQALGTLKTQLVAVGAGIGAMVGIATKLLGEVFAGIIRNVGTGFEAMMGVVTGVIDTLTALIGGLVATGKALLEGDFAGAWQAAQTMVEGVEAGITTAVNAVETLIVTAFGVIYDAIVNTINDIAGTAIPKFDEMKSSIVDAVETAKSKVDAFSDALRGFWDWISGKVFEFKIKLPELPDWATPGSPIPLHTRWKDFGNYLDRQTFTFNFDAKGSGELSGGGGGMAGVSQLLDNIKMFVAELGSVADNFGESTLEKVGTLADSSVKLAEIIPHLFVAIDVIKERHLGGFYVAIEKVAALQFTWDTIFEHFAVIAWHFHNSMDKVSKLVENGLKISELIQGTTDAFETLRTMPTLESLETQIGYWRHNLQLIVTNMVGAANHFTHEGLSHMELFAESAKTGLGFVKTAVTSILDLKELGTIAPLLGETAAFGTNVRLIVGTLVDAAMNFGDEQLAKLQSFSESAGAGVGLVGQAVSAINSLKSLEDLSPLFGQIASLGLNVRLIIGTLVDVAKNFEVEGLDAGNAFAERAGKLLGFVTTAVDHVLALVDYPLSANITPRAQQFADDAMAVLDAIFNGLKNSAAFADDSLDAAVDLAEKSGSLFGMVESAMVGIAGVVGYSRGAGDASIMTHIDEVRVRARMFSEDAVKVLEEILNALKNSTAFADDALDEAVSLADSGSSLFDMVESAYDAVAGVVGYEGGAADASIITNINDIRLRARRFGADAVAVLEEIFNALKNSTAFADEALGEAVNLADSGDSLFGMVESALAGIAGVVGYERAGLGGGLSLSASMTSIRDKARVFAEDAVAVLDAIFNALKDSTSLADDSLQSASELADSGGSLFDMVESGLDAIAGVVGYEKAGGDKGLAADFMSGLRQSARDFASDATAVLEEVFNALKDSSAFADEALGEAESLADSGGGILGFVGDAFEAVAAVADYVGKSNIRDKAADFAADLVAILEEVFFALRDSKLKADESMDAAVALAGKMGELLGPVEDGLGAVGEIAEFVAQEDIREKAADVADHLIDTAVVLKDAFNGATAQLPDEELDSATGLAGRVSEMAGVVQDIGDTIADIAAMEQTSLSGTIDYMTDELGDLTDFINTEFAVSGELFGERFVMAIRSAAEEAVAIWQGMADTLTNITNGMLSAESSGGGFSGGIGGGGGFAGGTTVVVSPGAVQLTMTGQEFDESRVRGFMADVMRDWLTMGSG